MQSTYQVEGPHQDVNRRFYHLSVPRPELFLCQQMNFVAIAQNNSNSDSERSDSPKTFNLKRTHLNRNMEHNPDRFAAMQQQLQEMQNARKDSALLTAEGDTPLDQSPKELVEILELDKIVRQIKLVLGGEPTKEIAKAELKVIANLPAEAEHKLPKTIKAALNGPNSSCWRDTAQYEINKSKSLEVWEPVNPYKGVKALGARWVFNFKRLPVLF
ncbi:hypothetical protein PCASD_22848 [Puccinia coronata f. sp. avenae]|uniref:Reverse transcriptase Ty1/copia-type domain-containing protein n=1 Tax=Puccinia coronata f. sp. avenae TaxID=200324 RepID=A0A2N5TR68_9BASI|nr:hypothetical protein PCASD_22848 [Puccinia coronata f. sp. avenae]